MIAETRRGTTLKALAEAATVNLAKVLQLRAAELAPPIQMSDALSRNVSAEFETIVANCIAHARRYFVDASANFPAECRYVLESLKVAYVVDAAAKKECLSADERLRLHQQHTAPVFEALRSWITRQFDEKLVEKNSQLGAALDYLRKHWEKLTLFLRVAGAPLDNNICERALKKAIIHRKNSLFYKTDNGAAVGDLRMSLIQTCVSVASAT
ncbi:MAG: transposase [Pirellulales bacterium]